MSQWFTEKHTPNVGITFKVKKEVFSKKTPFQKLRIIDTYDYGKVMLLDGCVMVTEREEFVYHEMITHVPLCVHPHAKKVLIIGGGDGGVVREVLKHKRVEEVHLCEIDKEVVDASVKYFPTLSSCLKDSRVKVFCEDGLKFIKKNKGYDVILVDSTDPVGPATDLFKKKFLADVSKALKDDGIMVAQTESPFYHQAVIRKTYSILRSLFPIVNMYLAFIPSYPSGMWSFGFCSKTYSPLDFNVQESEMISKSSKYYNSSLHKSAFSLPNFVEKIVKG